MSSIESQLQTIGGIIDDNTNAGGARWLNQAHAIFKDMTEILILHKQTDDGENEYLVREYPKKMNVPHKQARFSERKWEGINPGDAIHQRTRRVYPELRLDMEHIGFDEFDIVWASRRVGRLIENKTQEEFKKVKELLAENG